MDEARPIIDSRRHRAAACALLALFAFSGCAAPPRATPQQQTNGLVLMVPGIRGDRALLYWAARGLLDAGLERELRIYDWYRFPALANLVDLERNRRHAQRIADELIAYHAENPTGVIDVVGYSGGGGLALMAVENLPPHVPVRHLVLVQAAVSPTYDLTRALARLRGNIVNLYSPGDWFVLGLGTCLFGTLDRQFLVSAGKRGFDLERAVPNECDRPRLVQVPWTSEMMGAFHFGGHVEIILYDWNKAFVAPYLK